MTVRLAATRARLARSAAVGALLCGMAGAAVAAPALPSGGQVSVGSAAIASSAGAVTINQSSAKAVINWQGFSIGQGGQVQFNNGAGATLNRVTGAAASSIDGSLLATGSVFLINPNGVIVGKSGVVSVGGSFVASTLNVSDANFLAGGSQSFAGTSAASVVNLGKVGALGGDVALIGAKVENDGEVDAPNGTAGLIAGSSVLMRDAALDDGKFAVLVGGAKTGAANGGVIAAANAELRAEGGNVYALAGDTAGVIRATGVAAGDGHVWLVADGGDLTVAGTIDAQGAQGGPGQIETSGGSVKIGGATIDAHGGQWLIDPVNLEIDAASANTISNALATSNVTEQTTFNAATGTGIQSPGEGDITLDSNATISWSSSHLLTLSAYASLNLDGAIDINGTGVLTANAVNGGGNVGAGSALNVTGNINVAGPGIVLLTAPRINVSGAITLAGAGSLATSSNSDPPNVIDGGNITFTGSGGALAIDGQNYTLEATLPALSAAIASNPSGLFALAENYDATVDGVYAHAAIPTTFSGTLQGLGHSITSYQAYAPGDASLGLFATIGGSGSVLDLTLANTTIIGANAVGALAGINDGTIADDFVTSGTIVDRGGGSVGGLVGVNGTGSILGSAVSGIVVTDTNATATDQVGGLVGLNQSAISNSTSAGVIGGSGALAATGAAQMGGLVGDNASNPSDGILADVAYSSTSMVLNSIPSTVVYVGGLVGENTAQGYVQASYATNHVGAATGASGGLVGFNDVNSGINQSYATGIVQGADMGAAGGLVGANAGNIAMSSAFGSVTADTTNGANLGGLAGWNSGTIATSFAAGWVTDIGVNARAGGLVGVNDANVEYSYATGAVTVSGSGGSAGPTSGAQPVAGGLIGYNTGSSTTQVIASYASGAVSIAGQNAEGGGLVGYNDGLMSEDYALGSVTGSGGAYIGGFVGYADYDLAISRLTGGEMINTAYSTGAVAAASGQPAPLFVGGFAGFNASSGSGGLSNNYWDSQTSGQPTAGVGNDPTNAGVAPLTTAQFMNAASFTGGEWQFGPSATWVIVDADGTFDGANGATRPMLTSEITQFVVQTNTGPGVPVFQGTLSSAHQLQLLDLYTGFVYGVYTFVLDTYIVASETSNASGVWGGQGFVSLGNPTTSQPAPSAGFTQTLDGRGYSISQLYINEPTDVGVGLFSVLSSSGVVENLALSGGNISGYNGVGAIVGENFGTVTNVTTLGVYVSATGGPVGGLVGLNEAGAEVIGSSSWETGSVSGFGNTAVGLVSGTGVSTDVGGLVGLNAAGGQVIGSTSSETVGATGAGVIAGGLVGANGGSITGGLAYGGVTGGTWTGGLVGYNVGTISDASTSDQVVGVTLASSAVGGLVGYNGAGGLITVSSSTVTVIANGANDAAGGLVGLNGGTINGGSWASGPVIGDGLSGGLAGYNGGAIAVAFAGGSVSGTGGPVGGLVGYNAGTISGAASLGGTVSGTSGSTDVGGLVGVNATGAQISGSSSSEAVSASGSGVSAGGLVGANGGSITGGSSASGSVSGGTWTGGLVGYNDGTISGASTSGGAVNVGDSSAVGGLVGYNDTGGLVTVSSSSEAVSAGGAGDDAGGLVGFNTGSINGGSWASGSVTGDTFSSSLVAGGLVGYNNGTITDAFSGIGTVTSAAGTAQVGGLVGENDASGQITGSGAFGTVSASGAGGAGGLVGYNLGLIKQAKVTGNVSGGGWTGGLVGFNGVGGAIMDTYATGSVGGGTNVGGLVGYDEGAVSTSWVSGPVTGGGGLFGFVNGAPAGSVTLKSLYWDEGTTGQTVGIAGQNGTINQTNVIGIGGLTGISPTSQATYQGFDFTHIWAIKPGARPYLQIFGL